MALGSMRPHCVLVIHSHVEPTLGQISGMCHQRVTKKTNQKLQVTTYLSCGPCLGGILGGEQWPSLISRYLAEQGVTQMLKWGHS